MTAAKANLRSNNKYAEARAWAYDLITNSTSVISSEMAEMMAEQFNEPKKNMQHTLNQMAHVGIIKVIGKTLRNGKNCYVYASNKRRTPTVPTIPTPAPPAPAPLPAPAPNGTGAVTITVYTVNGPVMLTVEQAKALNEGLTGLFK